MNSLIAKARLNSTVKIRINTWDKGEHIWWDKGEKLWRTEDDSHFEMLSDDYDNDGWEIYFGDNTQTEIINLSFEPFCSVEYALRYYERTNTDKLLAKQNFKEFCELREKISRLLNYSNSDTLFEVKLTKINKE